MSSLLDQLAHFLKCGSACNAVAIAPALGHIYVPFYYYVHVGTSSIVLSLCTYLWQPCSPMQQTSFHYLPPSHEARVKICIQLPKDRDLPCTYVRRFVWVSGNPALRTARP
jgi:hypothetical protein